MGNVGQSLMRNARLAVGSGRRVVTELPSDSAEWRQFQLCRTFMFVIVTARSRGWSAVATAAAAAAVQKSPAQWAAQKKQQCWSHSGPTEQQQLGKKMQDGHGVLRNARSHVCRNYVTDVLRHHTRSVDDSQRHNRAVHLALQPDLLLVAAHTGLLRVADFAGRHQRAPDGEEGRQAEVAAEAPPQPSALVGETQHVEHVGKRGGYPDDAALNRRLIRESGVLCYKLPDEKLREGQEEGADPDDCQLGSGRSAVLDHLVVHLDIGGRAKAVDAERAEGEGGNAEGGHLKANRRRNVLKMS